MKCFALKILFTLMPPGPKNTYKVIDAVVERLTEGDIKFL